MLLVISAPLEGENFEKGISSRNLELAKSFDSEVWIVMTDFSHREKKSIDVSVAMDYIRFAVRLRNLVRSIEREYILLTNAIPLEPLFIASRLHKQNCRKMILDIRDVWPDAIGKARNFRQWAFYFYCSLLKYSIRWRDIDEAWYVAPSFVNWLPTSIRQVTKFLPLGFDSVRWGSLKEKTRCSEIAYNQTINRKINLLYIGYFSDQFELEPLLKFAADNDSEIKFDLIGSGEKLALYRERYSSCNNIIFHGGIDPIELVDRVELLNPDFGLIPLRPGAGARMPNKLFDYIALCIPIVSFNSADAADFLEKYHFGLSFDFADIGTQNFLESLKTFEAGYCRDSLREHRDKMSMNALYKDLWS